MKIYPDCYSCFLKQALKTTRFAGGDEEDEWQVLKEVMKRLISLDTDQPPPVMAREIQHIVRDRLGKDDLYGQVKKDSTREVLDIYTELKKIIESAREPLDTAVRLSIAGNIIDYGSHDSFDLEETIKRVLRIPYGINDMNRFYRELERAEDILYIGDNAGETVFDRLLIETMQTPVVYAVKSGPVLNDATMEDAMDAGLDQVARIIENGSDVPGTVLKACSDEFIEYFEKADMIIAKGQGNFETLNEARRSLFFFLQTKCPVISTKLGLPKYSLVCFYHKPENIERQKENVS